jgi:putative tryptophan/tyrosine transport system substrate-binding protein
MTTLGKFMAINVGRRRFISALGGAAAWPLAARAQQPAMPIVGILNHNNTPEAFAPSLAAFRQGLREQGYEEGHNVAIAIRYALAQADRLPTLADELLGLNVAVIFASGGFFPGNAAAEKKASATTPIVFVSGGDMVEGGLIRALNRPGGNFTGVIVEAIELDPKRLELLDQIVPKQAALAFLVDGHDVTVADAEAQAAEAAAGALGRRLTVVRIAGDGDLEPAFAAMAPRHDGGVAVGVGAFFNSRRQQIVQLAARYAVPAVYEFREFARDGGLMSYGTDLAAVYHLAGQYVARVLKGERPADMPVQRATMFNLVINLKVAKTLRLTLPLPLLGRADEVIE